MCMPASACMQQRCTHWQNVYTRRKLTTTSVAQGKQPSVKRTRYTCICSGAVQCRAGPCPADQLQPPTRTKQGPLQKRSKGQQTQPTLDTAVQPTSRLPKQLLYRCCLLTCQPDRETRSRRCFVASVSGCCGPRTAVFMSSAFL